MITAETTSETFFEYSKISKEIQKVITDSQHFFLKFILKQLIETKLIESITDKLFKLPYSEGK